MDMAEMDGAITFSMNGGNCGTEAEMDTQMTSMDGGDGCGASGGM